MKKCRTLERKIEKAIKQRKNQIKKQTIYEKLEKQHKNKPKSDELVDLIGQKLKINQEKADAFANFCKKDRRSFFKFKDLKKLNQKWKEENFLCT